MPSVVSTGEVTVLQVAPHGSNSKTVGSTGLMELRMPVAVMVVTGCLPSRPNRINSRTHLWSFLGPVTTERSLVGCGTGTVMHGTGSDQFVYNKRLLRPEETYVHIGNGHKLKVEWFGSLDVVLHCKKNVPVTLEDVDVVPSLAFDLMSINCVQERYDVLMNREGAWLLNDRVHFVKSPTGNYIAATRVKHRSADPPAMVAAMALPGPQRSMNCDDLHFSLGHTNDDNARETAKQRGIKVTGVRGYCDGCGVSKAIRRAVPKETTLKAERPMKRVFVDLAGPFLTSAGGARYCMLMVDDYTSVGWTLSWGTRVVIPCARPFDCGTLLSRVLQPFTEGWRSHASTTATNSPMPTFGSC